MAPIRFEHNAKPGDLIEIFHGAFEHWAVYIGGNEVVHLTPLHEDPGPLSGLLAVLDCSTGQVRRQKIWKVVGQLRFIVNNLLDDKYEPRERRLIVRDACRMVSQRLRYSAITRNCEHFVTELRYGKPESRQVKRAVIGGVAVAGVGIVALGAALVASLLKDDDEERRHHE